MEKNNNDDSNDGLFASMIRPIKISKDFCRTPLYQLGDHAPYFRTIDFPEEVRQYLDSSGFQKDSDVSK